MLRLVVSLKGLMQISMEGYWKFRGGRPQEKNKFKALELTGSAVRFPEQFADTHLYSWVEKGTVRAQKHNTMSPDRLKARLLDLGTGPLTMESLHFPRKVQS